MKIYLVGGAVRDALLGLPVQDCDWVVVGSTPEAMVAQGFKPVGKDFPVFLHPHTHDEYALARTERKTAPGYKGFVIHAAPDVTLEEDLARRDITINSIAVCAMPADENGQFDPVKSTQTSKMAFLGEISACAATARAQRHEDGANSGNPANPATDTAISTFIDPFGGLADLHNKVLRHVSPAFSEDPVRILRVARFAARFPDFAVAPGTLQLMRHMVLSGEANALVPERVWQEISKGLMAARPSRMLQVLNACGGLQILWQPLRKLKQNLDKIDLDDPPTDGLDAFSTLDRAAQAQAPLPVRFAVLVQLFQPGSARPNGLGRVPRDCQALADLCTAERDNLARCQSLDAMALMQLLTRCDALRRPGRFEDMLWAYELLAGSAGAGAATAYMRQSAQLVRTITINSITAPVVYTTAKGEFVAQALLKARIEALAQQSRRTSTQFS